MLAGGLDELSVERKRYSESRVYLSAPMYAGMSEDPKVTIGAS